MEVIYLLQCYKTDRTLYISPDKSNNKEILDYSKSNY